MVQPTSHSYPVARKRPTRLGITQKEAAEYLGVSSTTIRDRINKGAIATLADGSVDPSQFPGLIPDDAGGGELDENGSTQSQRAYWLIKLDEAKARKAWLDYQLAAGDLVDKSVVSAQYFDIIHRTRDRILAVPDRLAPLVAGLSDARKCRDVILREIRSALEGLADELDELGSEDASKEYSIEGI